jgi:hypothetical protein
MSKKIMFLRKLLEMPNNPQHNPKKENLSRKEYLKKISVLTKQ